MTTDDIATKVCIDAVATLLIAHEVAERGDFYRFDVEGELIKAESFRIYNEPITAHDKIMRDAALKAARISVECMYKLGWRLGYAR